MIGAAARAVAAAACLCMLPAQAEAAPQAAKVEKARESEVFYHIFMRSFRDSDGDRAGDLGGITEKLDYLVDLGITSILLTPLQPSPYYHNYFATDFEGIDPAFGTMDDYFAFVRAAHGRGLKVYLDQEIQYVAEGHPWLTEARGNAKSPFSKYLLWNRPGNQEPEPFLNQPAWLGYDGRYIGIAMVDMRQRAVKDYFEKLLLFWADPHGDGSLRDGVDGYRIDHMMDDLDNKKRLTNLFADFWTPIFRKLKARNPNFRILAEQSDWGYGEDWLKRGNADVVFAFPLRGAITKLDRREIVSALRETEAKTPAGKSQIVFIENHDTDRFTTLGGNDPSRAYVGAALNVLLKGEPLLYYGQEIGMRGRAAPYAGSDAAHIPLREAFRWSRDLEAPGSAIWYKGDRAWWTERHNRSGDGISVEEQDKDPNSLLNWYRRLLHLRAARPELRNGDQRILCEERRTMLCVLRTDGNAQTLILANLGTAPEAVPSQAGSWVDLLAESGGAVDLAKLQLAPMEIRVLGTR